MSLDDTTGLYLDSRTTAYPTPSQQLDERLEGERRQKAGILPPPDPMQESFLMAPPPPRKKGVVETAGDVAKDVAMGVVETPRQVVGGAADAVQEALNFADSVGESIENFLGIRDWPTIIQFTNEKGELDFDLLSRNEWEGKTDAEVGQIMPEIDDPRSTTGSLVRGVSQFLTAFALPAKKLKGVMGTGKGAAFGEAAAAGAIADFVAFDPHEARLSNLIEESPALANPVSEFLAASPDDSEAEGRFKNAVEGLGLGALAEGFTEALKGIRAMRVRKLEAKEAGAEQETIERLAGVDEVGAATKEAPKPPEPKPKPEPAFTVGSQKAGEERALNINLNRIETTDDVKTLIEGVGEKLADDINLERREVITHEETIKLADNLGMTVEDLLNRRRGESFNAEQAVAARRILVASGTQLVEAAKAARRGGEDEMIAFRRILAQHNAIQKQVSGMTAEAGRALSSFNIKASSDTERERMIKEALDLGGGENQTRQMAEMFSTLDDPAQINTMVDQVSKATKWDMVYEAWINGLLSGPATHAVNVVGNALTISWQVSERKVASWIGGKLDRQTIPDGEVKAQMWGMVNGARDGMRLAWQSLKTGEPSDQLTKIETQQYRAISAENLELSGTAGKFADFVGETVRLPGRFLTAGDEFFKAIGYRMELHAQAFRTATSEGLEGEAFAKRVQEIISDPPENIHLSAIDAARYQTFTNELGPAGQKTQELVSTAEQWTRENFNIPSARVIMPFIKTPVNIMSYVGERTPLAPISKSIRDDIAAGGARRDLALARIATGSMIMAAAADLALSGQVSGGGPADPVLRQNLRNTGWQPYSIKVGDTWYSYNRLDPVGATIGMAADAAEILGQVGDDADAMDISAAMVVSVAQNVTSKTYLSGLSDFFEVMSSSSTDPEANNTKAVQWIERLAGSMVPTGVAQVERTLSPELSATQGIIDKWRSRIPGLSEDLPPRRNIFGEPIVLEGGIGPDIMSPVYTSSVKPDLVTDEIVRNRTRLTMPQKTMSGIRLTPEEYDQYIQIFAGPKPGTPPFKEHLRQVMMSSDYRNASDGPDGMKSLMIMRVKEAHNAAAKAMLMERNPDLASRVGAERREKQMKRAGNF